MGTVSDIASARAARNQNQPPPSRRPDMEVDIWFDRDPADPNVLVEWVGFHATAGEWPAARVWPAMVDAAWMFAEKATTKDGQPAHPVVWMLVDATGHQITLYPGALMNNTRWRPARLQAMWLTRWAWRAAKKYLELAWRAGSSPWRARRAASK